MEMNETTAKTPRVDGDVREFAADEIDDPMLALVVRQQELIVQQSEQLSRAMNALLDRQPMSLRAELDELFGALAKITPDDLMRAGDIARMLLDMVKRSCAVGGGAVRGAS